MAGSFITVTPSGHEPVLAYLQQLQQKTGNLQPVLADIGEHLVKSTQERRRTQTDPEGNPWEPLSATTVALKGDDKILYQDGYLFDLLNYDVDPLALYFGTPQEYGAMMQFGGVTSPKSWMPGKDIPARPFLGLSQDDQAQILDKVAAYLAET